jgi:hypothetical protein
MGLLPFPGYNIDTFPYVLIKDSKYLIAMNVRNRQTRVIIKNSPCMASTSRPYSIDIIVDPNDNKKALLFNLESKSIKVDGSEKSYRNTSTIAKYSIDLEALDSCFDC